MHTHALCLGGAALGHVPQASDIMQTQGVWERCRECLLEQHSRSATVLADCVSNTDVASVCMDHRLPHQAAGRVVLAA